MSEEIGSKSWNDEMYKKHPTPYYGIAGFIQRRRLVSIMNAIKKFKPSTSAQLIVEIGCEEGHLVEHLLQELLAYQFLGLDISTKALVEAKITRPSDIYFDQGISLKEHIS
jgi:trans-aconitate methyltransferase